MKKKFCRIDSMAQFHQSNGVRKQCKFTGKPSLAQKIIHCPPLNRITLGQHNSDNNNRMIQLTDVFCALFKYYWASNI